LRRATLKARPPLAQARTTYPPQHSHLRLSS
jgi:hypothetical protein